MTTRVLDLKPDHITIVIDRWDYESDLRHAQRYDWMERHMRPYLASEGFAHGPDPVPQDVYDDWLALRNRPPLGTWLRELAAIHRQHVGQRIEDLVGPCCPEAMR